MSELAAAVATRKQIKVKMRKNLLALKEAVRIEAKVCYRLSQRITERDGSAQLYNIATQLFDLEKLIEQWTDTFNHDHDPN